MTDLERIATQRYAWLINMARRITRNDADAADAAQEGLLHAFRWRGASPDDWDSWILTCVMNEARMVMRQRQHRASRLPFWKHHVPSCVTDTPESLYSRREQDAWVRRQVSLLPPILREQLETQLRLSAADGTVTRAEVGDVLGLNREASISRHWRAMTMLRQRLQGEGR